MPACAARVLAGSFIIPVRSPRGVPRRVGAGDDGRRHEGPEPAVLAGRAAGNAVDLRWRALLVQGVGLALGLALLDLVALLTGLGVVALLRRLVVVALRRLGLVDLRRLGVVALRRRLAVAAVLAAAVSQDVVLVRVVLVRVSVGRVVRHRLLRADVTNHAHHRCDKPQREQARVGDQVVDYQQHRQRHADEREELHTHVGGGEGALRRRSSGSSVTANAGRPPGR
eukprot:5782726-Prymnesium_polylepis.1